MDCQTSSEDQNMESSLPINPFSIWLWNPEADMLILSAALLFLEV
jgi:hypothetical protein